MYVCMHLGGVSLAGCPWRGVPGGVSLAGCPWRGVPGGVSLAGCPWRGVPGGVSLAGCPWRGVPGEVDLPLRRAAESPHSLQQDLEINRVAVDKKHIFAFHFVVGQPSAEVAERVQCARRNFEVAAADV